MIPLFWYRGFDNFGDRLSPFLASSVAGQPVDYAEGSPKLLAVGSLLSFARSGDVLWGTGAWRDHTPVREKIHIRAVRGPLTRSMLLEQGIECPEIYGDPALLLPRYYEPKIRKHAGVTLLPHRLDRWLFLEGARVLSADDDPLEVVDRIASSEILVTSSLHGLIVAEAFGVPVVLLRNRKHCEKEPQFKYTDYFASTGREDLTLFDLPVEEAMARRLPPPVFPDLDRLVEAFPKNMIAAASPKTAKPVPAGAGLWKLSGSASAGTDYRVLFNAAQEAADREDFHRANLLFQQAASLPGGAELWRWKSLGFCPSVFPDEESIRSYREKLDRSLDLLLKKDVRFDWRTAPRDGFTPPFNLPHHGLCCREIKEKYAVFFAKQFPFEKPSLKETRGGRSKIHVGFVVTTGHHRGFLHVNREILRRLDREKFEIHVIGTEEILDVCRRDIASDTIRYVGLSGSLETISRRLRELKLDILYHWKVGGGPLDYFLPFLQAAPIQCVSLGSHGTSGVSCVDYFLSYGGLEQAGSEDQYTETLYRLDAYPTIHVPGPPAGPTSRGEFGLPEQGAVYCCPHRLAKYHPSFDDYFREILDADPDGRIVLLTGRKKHLAEQLMNRLKNRLGETLLRRIVPLGRLDLDQYRKLLSLSTCVLDSPVYAGDLTTHDALEQGIPVVTLPGRLLVENYTAALCRSIDLPELIAENRESYVRIALELGRDRDYRDDVQGRILENRDRLFSHGNTVSEYERFFETALETNG